MCSVQRIHNYIIVFHASAELIQSTGSYQSRTRVEKDDAYENEKSTTSGRSKQQKTRSKLYHVERNQKVWRNAVLVESRNALDYSYLVAVLCTTSRSELNV